MVWPSRGPFRPRGISTEVALQLLEFICSGISDCQRRYLRTCGLVSVRGEVESYESFVIQERWPDSEGPPMWTNENRARYDRSHLRYPSDLTDDEWKLVERLIPPGRRGGDKRTVIMREVV